MIIIDPANPALRFSSLNSGLVGHWSLSESSFNPATKRFTDKTPNENHGTSANAASFTTDRKGQSNRAMSFDGTEDYVGTNYYGISGGNPRTIAAWIKTTDIDYETIVLYGTEISYQRFEFSKENQILGLKINGANRLFTAANINDGNWHHAALSMPNSATLNDISMYMDGVSLSESSSTEPTNSINTGTSYPVNIGRNGIGDNRYLNGTIADVRIYNRALSQQEITLLYDSYRPKITTGSLQKGLVLDMPLTSGYTKDETAGSLVMTDRTPYSNDGQNSGGDVDTDHTTFVSANNDYVDCGSGNGLSNLGGTDFTLSAWIKTDVTTGSLKILRKEGIGPRVYMRVITGVFMVLVDDGTTIIQMPSDFVADDDWHNVLATFDISDTFKLYIDGDYKVQSSSIAGLGTLVNNNNLNISDSADTFNGDISNVRIYNRALTEGEVLSLFEKCRGN